MCRMLCQQSRVRIRAVRSMQREATQDQGTSASDGACASHARTHPPSGGLTKCKACNEVQSKYQVERHAKLKAAGLCVECGEIPSVPGRAMCELCRIDNLDRVRAIKRERVECQLCIRCGAELPDDFYQTCEKCRYINSVYCLIDANERKEIEASAEHQR